MTADARFWDGIADKYSRTPVANPDAFERKIAITRARMSPDAVVLDIGCGTGSLALRLAPHAKHVHGLDVSQEMTRIARGKAAAQGVDNVTFHTTAFDDGFTALEPGSLQGICAYSVLHLVEDRAAVLARIYELLEPGGFFVSSTTCLRESRVPFGPLLWVMRKLGKAPKVERFERATLEDEIRRAGFVELQGPDVGAERIIAFLVAHKPG